MTNTNINSYVKEVVIQLQTGPYSYVINETGYGFAVERCDDQSSIIQVEGQTGDALSLTEVSKMIFPTQFTKLYITNFEQIVPGSQEFIKLLIIKDPKADLSILSPYRAVSDAMIFAQLYILMASGATTRYAIWEVDASSSIPSSYTDPNQLYFSTTPLIQYIQPISIASGSAFTLYTTAISNLISLEQYPQPPIPSTYLQPQVKIPLMGYSVVYTPTVTASGTSIFLVGIQQPLSMQQLSLDYDLTR